MEYHLKTLFREELRDDLKPVAYIFAYVNRYKQLTELKINPLTPRRTQVSSFTEISILF